MIITNITLGADPELFIINKKSGEVVSSVGLIPGEKGNPYVGDDMPKGFGLETDNVLAEFNIPPARDISSFVNNIEYMKNYIRNFIQQKNPDLDILCVASKEVPTDQLNSPEAKLFGCDVDYNAYTRKANPKPRGEETNLRSAGFHLHVGYDNYNTNTSLGLIKYLDAYVGLSSLLYDTDKKRRTLYGKAGSFRLTPYGLEYRVLSSAMMATPNLIELVCKNTFEAIGAYNCGKSIPDYENTRQCIDESDSEFAKRLMSRYHICVESGEL